MQKHAPLNLLLFSIQSGKFSLGVKKIKHSNIRNCTKTVGQILASVLPIDEGQSKRF